MSATGKIGILSEGDLLVIYSGLLLVRRSRNASLPLTQHAQELLDRFAHILPPERRAAFAVAEDRRRQQRATSGAGV